MEDFRRKARLVAGGHMTTAPAAITYASVVSRESVRITITLAALNGLEVKVGDVENAFCVKLASCGLCLSDHSPLKALVY